MNENFFSDSLKQINTHLINETINRTMNSIGSHIFLDFGKDIECASSSGKKKWLRKEWSIWIGNSSWRITKYGKYFVGSGENIKIDIKKYLNELINKHFQSLNFLSQFLDAEFNFEDGFQLTTFFNWAAKDQWAIFLPDKSNISIDCSNEETIRNVKAISNHCTLQEQYQQLNLPLQNLTIKNIIYNEIDLPIFLCENDFAISLEICTWRIEKNHEYYVGYLDDSISEIKEKLSELIGEKIKHIDIANSMMDARFQIGAHYALKTFCCCSAVNQWNIFYKDDPIFAANIQVSDERDFYIQENG